ncbi:disintegrin and metalloproteinase domain-containing protein 12-like [Gadus macrocephalus]|uniref:disintegrin and metalloproteinase domain-containing protein 12-like n=1 Tax=Gadus macrocephalus TaxID=80720 RepID=UPI0028CBAC89|nr:disintegrin and metalloproteinase domain-containing protein 12-like [Gadus macrocephalus]
MLVAMLLKLAGTPCRESSNSCDLPEYCTGAHPLCPANVYLHDGHACHSVDGHCYNGICQTHEQQCITLWGPERLQASLPASPSDRGDRTQTLPHKPLTRLSCPPNLVSPGAKAAPGICFKRVNSAGDPYGNCGKDSKGSFAKCEARDAQCGKIQCQGGANRPVIGTNAVSIETNIPLQEGGRILCRGTHVYLGDDMPDPGLVLTGTKCGDGMMCLNRRCQNVSVFSVQECSSKCSGRGVCNNNNNCHCEPHWAPPFCDAAGFGGSVDSGPMRLADSRGVIVGVLVALLSLLGAGLVVCVKRKSLPGGLLTGGLLSGQKNPLEQLRSVSSGPGRTASPPHPQSPGATSPGATSPAPAPPPSTSIYKVNKVQVTVRQGQRRMALRV